MPTYEYRCNACQREFEIQQKMADPDLVHCDACGEDKLEKLISWTSVRSNSYQDALLTGGNPREALKGTNAIDRSRPPKKETPAAAPAEAEAAASAEVPAPATPATPPTPAVDEDKDDDDDAAQT